MNTSKATRLATAYNLPLAVVEKVLGDIPEADSLKSAYNRYMMEEATSPNKPILRHMLNTWIRRELANAKTAPEHRAIFGQTPEDFPVILKVMKGWDQATRLTLSNKKVLAIEAHDTLKGARPATREYFRAKKRFDHAFERDHREATRLDDTQLLFVLIEIAPPENRKTIEAQLLQFCRSEPELRRLVRLVSTKEAEATVIRRLAKFL